MLSYDCPTNFRAILTLSMLTSRPVHLTRINQRDQVPGIRDYEVNFINMLNSICSGNEMVLSKKGDTLKFYPGIIMNNDTKEPTFDCGDSRSIGYYAEYLVLVALFGKHDLEMTLNGITNDDIDLSIDSMSRTLNLILSKFTDEGSIGIKILKRGFRPNGGGSIKITVNKVKKLNSGKWVTDGLVKRIRGTCYASKANINIVGRIISSVRGVFNDYIPDVWVYSEYAKGAKASKDPGYGITLAAETQTGSIFTYDQCFNHFGDHESNSPEELGTRASICMLDEIMNCGVVDTAFQSFALFLMALSGPLPSKIKLDDMLNVKFKIDDYVSVHEVLKNKEALMPTNPMDQESEEDLEKELMDEEQKVEEDIETDLQNVEIDESRPRQVILTCIGKNLKNQAIEMV